LLATAALAAYPEKPITIVVPFAAGGPTDKVARDLAEVLRKKLNNQTVVIENVGGAGGTLGRPRWPRPRRTATPCCCTTSAWPPAPALYRNLPFKTLDDFEYLGMVNDVPMTLIGRPRCRPSNYAELVKWLEANKGKINLANAGLGAASHLCGLLFQQSLKIDMTTVPYKGTAPAMTDLLGGQVDIMCDQTTNTTGQIESGKVKAYAVTTTKRLTTPALAKLPTLDEQGLKGFNVSHLARPVRPQGHAQGRGRQAQRGAARRAEGPRVHQAPGSPGRRGGDRRRLARPSTRSSSRPRSTSGARPSRPPASTPTD
jgi:tripartite-type tricarboxylate transporter receptor subunit TctC